MSKFRILPGVIKGLLELKRQGYRLAMVSNQDGLGTPAFPYKNFIGPQKKLIEVLKSKGIEFEKIFLSPDFPNKNSKTRKPATGLVKVFLENNPFLCRKASLVIGDRETDRQFSQNLDFRYVKIKTNGKFSLPKNL